MKKLNIKGVSIQTWVRTIVLIIALINQALIMFGVTKNELDIDSWISYVTYALTAISALWSWWKNNSFTKDAQAADKALNAKG